MSYLEVQINFTAENYDRLTGLLYIHEFYNLLEENDSIKFYLTEDEVNKFDNFRDELQGIGIADREVTVSRLEDKNWNQEWERSIEPVYINDSMIVFPSWKKDDLEDPEGKILIEIDPKMSFGTGHNETTQLVLELMDKYVDVTDKYMLDFGCGTGILAIAGIKLGMEKAIAIDIDIETAENTTEYFHNNKVNHKILFYISDIQNIQETNFDVICANIIRSVIVEKISTIKNKLKEGGKLFLSGILESEELIITNTLKINGFEIKEILRKAEWLGIYGIKKQQNSSS